MSGERAELGLGRGFADRATTLHRQEFNIHFDSLGGFLPSAVRDKVKYIKSENTRA